MWILECDGDLLGGKKMWLKPGQQYLFGRNKVENNEHSLGLNHKTVSRKHLVVTVAPIAPGEGLELYHKSALTLTDDSKIGTELDGHRLVKSSISLNGNKHDFYLGQAKHQKFRITWWPVVMTLQGSGTKFTALQSRLEQLDIKMIDAYVTSETTHVVASTRNVPKGLRGLVNARYLVSQDFIDAIESAATASAETGVSPLEEDFEGKWPNAMDYVPPPGTEPHPRPAELFKPDDTRRHLFDGFTFIFADARQHENLSPLVMDGGAKAIQYDMQSGETTVDEFVQFVLSVADKKGLRSLGDSDTGKGVVFVRFRAVGDLQEWSIRFIESVDAALEQRSIEQNEFLDAILTKDVSKLRQGLREEDSQHVAGIRAPPSTAAQATRPAPVGMSNLASLLEEPSQSAAQESVPASQPQRSAASKLRSRRVITQSRFKGFDDFDESQFSTQRRKSQVQEIEDSDDAESQNNVPSQSQSQAMSNANGNAMDDDQSLFISQSQHAPEASQASRLSNIRKRPAPQSPDENEDDAEDALFPAAAAMKRRKLEDAAAGKKPLPAAKPANVEPARKSKKPVKELDVASAARIRAEAIDAQRQQSETQRPDEEMTAEQIAEFRYLGITEEMKMRVPGTNPRARTGEAENERWDDRWNGRKNFKKFVKRRPGTAGDDDSIAVNNRARKVIVTLEEAKRKTFGVGEEDYFLNPAPGQGRRTKTGTSQSQAQSQSQPQHSQWRVTGYAPHTGAADEDDQEDLEPEEIAGQPREGVVADALRRISGQSATQTQSQASSRTTASGKRGASGSAASAPPAKMRATQAGGRGAAAVADDDDDDSDGEVKFRLRRPVRKA